MDANTTLKRLRNHYRLVIMNEDTYEEVIKFKLTRSSVYIIFSTLFILMIALTASLIMFTPLKYYLPGSGYGDARQMKEYRDLKIRTDSMERALYYQGTYQENLKKILQGKMVTLDTNELPVPKVENSTD